MKATARFLLSSLLMLLGLAALGCFFPTVPVLGELGPVLTSPFGPWLTITAVVGIVLMVWRWRSGRRRSAAIFGSIASFAALGSAYVQVQQVAVARANGVSIDFVAALTASSQADPTLRRETVNYTSFAGTALPIDIYRPTMAGAATPAPVLIYIHGGGWGGQTLRQREADYRWFADRGYLVLSFEYTLSTATRHTWNIAQPQLGCALAWVHANIGRYGGDVSRVALWGESAGGNLVLNMAYMANQQRLQTSCGGTAPPIRAVAALYPVVDPALMHHNPDPLMAVFGRLMTVNYTGGTPERYPDRYAAIASSTYINPSAPPTLLIIPEADHLVDPRAAYAFDARAKAAGIQSRLIRMPYAEHSFDLRSGSIGSQLVRQSMLQFLHAHGMRP